MSRRDAIRMSDAEVDEFLQGRHTMNIATIGHDGQPHLVAMWYGFTVGGEPAFWTYGKSQKVRNLERDSRLTALVETGETYDALKGVELVGRAALLTDPVDVAAVGESVYERYSGPVDDQARAALAVIGSKRVAVRIDVDRIVSWDHAKLGGRY